MQFHVAQENIDLGCGRVARGYHAHARVAQLAFVRGKEGDWGRSE
jgi:hypothetical protein